MSSGSNQPGRVTRPAARYRPGKAPIAAGSSYSSDEDSSSEESAERRRKREDRRNEGKDVPITDLSRGTAALKDTKRRTAGIVIQNDSATGFKKPIVKLHDVKIGVRDDGKKPTDDDDEVDSGEYETDTDEDEAGPSVLSKPVFRRPGDLSSSQPTSQQKEESSEYETDSEDEESEEDTRLAMLKPIFVSKKQRENQQQPTKTETSNGNSFNGAREIADGQDGEDTATREARRLAEERRKQSHLLAAETIKRELAEKEHDDAQPDLSDSDGRDPEEEFQAWRIRELSRLKAEQDLAKEREAEREEVERRRAMPESQRLAEDMQRANASREAKAAQKREAAAAAEGGGGAFMQKYYHKGSFFQDMDILQKRDYHAKTEGTIDKSLLPKVMQVRDYGKAGRSKWTHLANEDTTRQQQDHRMRGISGMDGNTKSDRQQKQQCFTCGGPHLRRDCPEANGGRTTTGGQGRGANVVPVRDRGSYSGRSSHDRHSRSPPERRSDWRDR